MMRRLFCCGLLALLVLFTACRKKEEAEQTLEIQDRMSPRLVELYFESPDLRLVAEQRSLILPERTATAMPLVLRELIKGPESKDLVGLFPPEVDVRAVYALPDGTAVVDLGGPPLAEGWSTGTHTELMAVYSVVQTLTSNFPEVRRVRFVVNGQPADTFAGHIDIRRAFTARQSLIAPLQ